MLTWKWDGKPARLDGHEWMRADKQEWVDNVVIASNVMKEDLEHARDFLERPDISVMEYLAPKKIGKKMDKVRDNIDSALDLITKIKHFAGKKEIFRVREMFSTKYQLVDQFNDISFVLEKYPAIDHYPAMLSRDRDAYNWSDHLPLFDGNGTEDLDKHYNADLMARHHHDHVVQKLPENGSTKSLHVLRNLLIDGLLSDGMDTWKEDKRTVNRVKNVTSMTASFEIGMRDPGSIDHQLFMSDMFPKRAGLVFCDKKLDDYYSIKGMENQRQVHRGEGAEEHVRKLESRRDMLLDRGNVILNRLKGMNLETVEKIQDKRDLVISMACVLEFGNGWFNENVPLNKGQRDGYLNGLTNPILRDILRDMSDHFSTDGSGRMTITAANNYLKRRGLD